MIYFTTTDGHTVVVLEPGNIIDLKAGETVHSPDMSTLIIYTPDILFFRDEMIKMVEKSGKEFDAVEFDRIHQESLKRPEVVERPYHEHRRIF